MLIDNVKLREAMEHLRQTSCSVRCNKLNFNFFFSPVGGKNELLAGSSAVPCIRMGLLITKFFKPILAFTLLQSLSNV